MATETTERTLDVREVDGPPFDDIAAALEALERLVELSDETVLVQRNDRRPQFLDSKLEDRGYRYETVERDDDVVTVVWRSI